jgi:LEA14-like dessication related protein
VMTFHKIPIRCWILAISIAGLIGACAGWGLKNAPPAIKLAAIRPLELQGLENRFEVDLRIFNQGDQSLVVRGIQCDLILNGRNFATGVGRTEKQIPAYGSDTVTLTVYSSMLDMARLIHGLIRTSNQSNAQKWTYAVKGHLQIGFGSGTGKVPFDTVGEIDLTQVMGTTH